MKNRSALEQLSRSQNALKNSECSTEYTSKPDSMILAERWLMRFSNRYGQMNEQAYKQWLEK